jgi:nitroimidazol reductase NimA-like FMN-containing flavoprotein (pyridoxamine 5'-phosphate oxidase superfamily)
VIRLSHTGQAPPLTNGEIESLLKENHCARICTHNRDGTIHAAPVAYEYLNGQIVIVSHASTRKTRNIKRNDDVTVLIDTPNPIKGVLIYGEAEIDSDNVYEQAVSVNEAYASDMPKDKVQRFTRAFLDAIECVIVKVTPKRIITFDHTKWDVYNNLVKTYLQE